MNKKITITGKDFPGLKLVSASNVDQERLRNWKNNNRRSIFYK